MIEKTRSLATMTHCWLIKCTLLLYYSLYETANWCHGHHHTNWLCEDNPVIESTHRCQILVLFIYSRLVLLKATHSTTVATCWTRSQRHHYTRVFVSDETPSKVVESIVIKLECSQRRNHCKSLPPQPNHLQQPALDWIQYCRTECLEPHQACQQKHWHWALEPRQVLYHRHLLPVPISEVLKQLKHSLILGQLSVLLASITLHLITIPLWMT